MIYYKQFHLDSFDIIKHKSQQYFQTWTSLPVGFTLLNKEEFLIVCPELDTDLKKYDIEIKILECILRIPKNSPKYISII